MKNRDHEDGASEKPKSYLPGRDLLTLIVVTLLFLYYFSGMTTDSYELVFLMQSSQETTGRVWWAGEEEDFDTTRSDTFEIIEGIETYRIKLPIDPVQLQKLRIDPGLLAGNPVRLHYLLIKRWGFSPFHLSLSELQPNDGIRIASLSNHLQIGTTTNDPSLMLTLDQVRLKFDWRALLLYLGLSILLLFLSYVVPLKFRSPDFNSLSVAVAICFAMVFVLALALALKAGFNASPDEKDHFMAAEFFKTHAETPHKRENLGLYTYSSLWSYSRVYQLGKHYLLSGKMSNLFDGKISSYRSVRLFGVFLLLVMMILALSFPGQALVWVPFLITPQTWYIFSYTNDDYFPLFLSMTLMVLTERYFQQSSAPKKGIKDYLPALILGILLGSLSYAKNNYQVFVLFYLLYIFMKPITLPGRLKNLKASWDLWKLPVLISSVALMVYIARQSWVYLRTGPPEISVESRQFFLQADENRARHIAGKSGEAQFGSYRRMMRFWIPMSYRSFNGVYDYMTLYAPSRYYLVMTFIHCSLLMSLFLYLIFAGSFERFLLSLLVLGTIAAMIFASSWIFSYKFYFQPQGRYLFPLIPVLGMFINRLQIPSRYYWIPFAILFALSFYSFVFVALINL